MEFQNRYQQLNKAQQQAVDTIDGPVMVLAGPGTGKTELLSVRVANILNKTDALPENILLLTFTESGQAAMRERLVGIIGKDAYKVAIHTFHSFGSDIIAANREYFYRNALFQPADDIKQYEILRSIFEELPFSNPLSSTMNGEYTHLSDAQKVISELKRNSALTSDELLAVIQQSEASLDTIERLIIPVFDAGIKKSTAAQLEPLLGDIEAHVNTLETLYEITPLAKIIYESLKIALDTAAAEHPTKPITIWKNAWLERTPQKILAFKDRKHLAKLKALSFIYYEYVNRMEKASAFDYDDMIMQVVHAMEVYEDLTLNLQEKYLYIMVDEFQDTNVAQLRILHNLTNNPVNEGRPNILVVGDDDQAVYGFQGADSSTITSFSETYPQVQRIILTDNYRSGADILAASRAVITQGTDRLEAQIPELSKQLAAQKEGPGTVEVWNFESSDSERSFIVQQIHNDITQGADPSSIAVLARRHAEIQSLLPFFRQANIPVRYDKQESVLDSPPIIVLEQLARVLVALAEGNHRLVESLLPELLAHPAWNISPHALWRLSLNAYTDRQNWMEIMATTPDFVAIHEWLVTHSKAVHTMPLEPLLDSIIGRPDAQQPQNSSPSIASPFYNYFFSHASLNETPSAYLEYLEALRTIRSKLREYAPGDSIGLTQFVTFIELHRRLGISIMIQSPSVDTQTSAVNLLTAHKAKGLEFDTVYVYNSVDSSWGQNARSRSRSIGYPANLPLAPSGSTADERIRLFYVAMTRAERRLFLTHSSSNDANAATSIANFLVDTTIPTIEQTALSIEDHTAIAETAWYHPLVSPINDLKTILTPQLEAFKLSATSLNNFLDVSRGGPEYFLLNNLLHFPQTKLASAAYGTAVHWTMQQAHTHVLSTGEQKPLEDSLHDFEVALEKERLDSADHKRYLQMGSEHIPAFIRSGVAPMTTSQKAEATFAHQDVRLDDARLTGSLDVIDINKTDKTISVTDYKTGRPLQSWDRGDTHEKMKLHRYRQQLAFYKILVEQSADYHTYTVTDGSLAFIEPTKTGESIVLPLNLASEDIERTKKLIRAVWKHIVTLDLPDVSDYSNDLAGRLAFEQDLIDEIV